MKKGGDSRLFLLNVFKDLVLKVLRSFKGSL